jgi:hypothetical protein
MTAPTCVVPLHTELGQDAHWICDKVRPIDADVPGLSRIAGLPGLQLRLGWPLVAVQRNEWRLRHSDSHATSSARGAAAHAGGADAGDCR